MLNGPARLGKDTSWPATVDGEEARPLESCGEGSLAPDGPRPQPGRSGAPSRSILGLDPATATERGERGERFLPPPSQGLPSVGLAVGKARAVSMSSPSPT